MLICFIGAASATEDVNSTVIADSGIDEVNAVGLEGSCAGDSDEINQLDINQNTEETNTLSVSGTNVNAGSWTTLKTYSEKYDDDYIIKLTGTSYTPNNQINFKNSATIIGTANSYITAGTYTGTPFINTDSSLTITFINVTFRDMSVTNLLELAGTNNLQNCNFYNITAATGHNAVIYNTDGTMNLANCNIVDSSAGYGVVSNYKAGTYTGVVMNVDDCTFVRNSASVEPGAINNCGILYVNNSKFINNTAEWWAGAIHTHYNAQTVINNSIFEGNDAGWNGGALYTYSTLKVYNSIFKKNKCHTNIGGGAIGASRWWGGNYDITIENCTFEENENCNTNGNGGAITAMNSGALNVHDSTFINNKAKNGQAIAAFSQAFENITAGIPNLKVYNNYFYNHTQTTSDTVEISGNYTFENNTFTNCYQTNLGTNNVIINPVTLNSNNLILKSNKESLLMSSFSENILKEAPNVIYVDVNSENDPESDTTTGKDWSTAYGTDIGINFALGNIADNGIIYLANGDYVRININDPKNITLIGQSKETLLSFRSDVYGAGAPNATYTFINMTIYHGVTKKGAHYNNYERNMNFINCSIIGDITIEKALSEADQSHVEEYGYGQTYAINFNNCEFKDITTENGVITLYKYGLTNFNNCTFENITADSIVAKTGDYYLDDGIYFKECKFNNCNVKGIVDVPGAADIETYCVIEDCDYDFDANLNVETTDNHNYVNATKLKVVAVETNTSISSSEKGIVTITVKDAEGNPVSNVNVNYTVNGENKTGITDDSGNLKVSDLTGEGEIKAYFEGNENYLKSEGSYKYNFTETTPTPDTNSSTNGTSGNGTSTNTGQTTTNTPKITKKATKITAKKATFKAKKKTKKYTIVLKAGKAAVKKVKVTLKVGKKTYKATTNSKGKATFKITKLNKKGKYTAVIKFKGNKNFKATSKKVKITVKK